MSRNVDQRVVEMQFDNKQFEKGVKQSVDSLKSLKSNLNMKEQNVTLSNLSKSVEGLSSKFSLLSVTAITAMTKLSNAAINIGTNFAKSLTIDPVLDGFKEYELKMNAIQTILTNTKSKGTTLTDVNSSLAELNDYADKTIYNFAQMTDNIGKFTAAGVGLEDSTKAIKGLSNVAAGFGVDAQRMASATYQMSQALAAGSIKLIDWNSLVQAGMGGEMIQTELKATAKQMGIFVDETKPFRETLEQGWLSSKVFIETMGRMAENKDLLAAATNVTTFTKLLGVMAESVASGWANTWEIILGNKDESTALWTGLYNAFSSFVSKITEARNNALKFWNDFGGRKDLLIGIANLLRIVGGVLGPVTDLFGAIIPDITGERLVWLSKAFRKFTELILGTGTSLSSVGRIFSGIGAIINVVGGLIQQIVQKILYYLSMLAPIGSMILNTLASIGDLGVGIKSIIDSIGGINLTSIKAVGVYLWEAFNNRIANTIVWISGLFDSLVLVLEELGISVDNFKSKWQELMAFLQPATNVLKKVGTGFTNIVNAIKKVSFSNKENTLVPGGEKSNNKTSETIDKLKTETENNFYSFSEILTSIKNAITKTIAFIKEQISWAFEGVTFQKVLHAIETFLHYGVLLAIRDLIKLMKASFTGLPEVLTSVTGAFDSVKSSLETWQSSIKAKMILDIAYSVAVLAGAMWLLSTIPSDKLKNAAIVIGVLFTQVSLATKMLASSLDVRTFATLYQLGAFMIALSISVAVLAGAVKQLEKLSWESVGKGIATVTALLFALTRIVKPLTVAIPGMISAGLGMIGIAYAIKLLAAAVIPFAKIRWQDVVKGTGAITGVMFALSILVRSTKNVDVLSASAGITLISGAMLIFASAIAAFGYMNFDVLIQGLSVTAILIGGLVLALRVLPSATDLLRAGIAIVAFAASVNMLVMGVYAFGKMDLRTLIVGISSLIVVLGSLVLAANLLRGASTAAGAIIALAAAINLLMIPIVVLGNLPIGVLVAGILAIGGALLMLGGVTYLLAPLAPVMVAISSGIALIGVGLLGSAAALVLFAAGLTALVGAIALIPLLGKALKMLIQEINEAIPMLGDTIDLLLILVINALPRITELVNKFLDMLLEIIVQFLIDLADVITRDTKVYDATVALIDFLVKVIVEELAPRLVKAAFNAIIDMGNAFQKGYEKMMADFGKTVRKSIDEGSFLSGQQTTEGFSKGMRDKIRDAAKTGSDIGNAANDGLKDSLDIRSPSEVMRWNGKYFVGGFVEGIKDETPKVYNFTKTAGENAADGFTQGLRSRDNIVKTWFNDMADSISGSVDTKVITDKIKNTLTPSLPNSFTESAKKSSSGIKTAGAIVKSAFEKSMEWIDDQKYFDRLNLQQELAKYEEMTKQYKQGSEERKKLDREIYRVKKEITAEQMALEEKQFTKSKEWISDRKYYNELTLQEELAAYERVQSRYQNGTEARKEMDKEVYRVRKELIEKEMNDRQAAYEFSNKWSQNEQDWERSNLRLQLEAQERILKAEQEFMKKQGINNDTQNAKDTKLKIEKLNIQIYEDEQRLIKDVTDIKKKSLKEITSLEKDKAEKTKEINKKERQDIKELNDAYKEAVKTRTDAIFSSFGLFDALDEERNRTKELIKLKGDLTVAEEKLNTLNSDKSAYDTTTEKNILNKQIENKRKELERIQEIQKTNRQGTDTRELANIEAASAQSELSAMLSRLNSLEEINKKYIDINKSRKDSELEIQKIKDDITSKDSVKGSDLIRNLQDQVGELETWRDNIAELERKGISPDLMSELRSMGPKALDELKALNKLSSGELTKYADLWSEKYRLANTQAKKELENMVVINKEKIQLIRDQAKKDLYFLNQDVHDKMVELETTTLTDITNLEQSWVKGLGNLASAARGVFTTLFEDIKKEFDKSFKQFEPVGENATLGVAKGMESRGSMSVMYNAAKRVAEIPLKTVADIMKIKSPSRAMFDLGVNATQGFINGLSNMGNSIVSTGQNIGNGTLDAIKEVISGISDFINSDMNLVPRITPVLDLSDVRSQSKNLPGILGTTSYSSARQVAIQETGSQVMTKNGQNGSNIITNQFNLSDITIREDADIQKIARSLYQLQMSKMRG